MTLAGEVLCPGVVDFIEVLLDESLTFRNPLWLEAEVRRELDGRRDPELRFVGGETGETSGATNSD